MKRKFIAFILIVLSALSVAACSGNGSVGGTNSPGNQGGTVNGSAN